MQNSITIKVFLGIISVVLLVLAFENKSSQPTKFGFGVDSSFTSSTNTFVNVGTNAAATSAVMSVNANRLYAKVCNLGPGVVTLCYNGTSCVFGSGIILGPTNPNTTSSAASSCNEVNSANLYVGAMTAVISATTTPGTTSTLGVVIGQ